jgi:hypothetical protein
MVTGADARGKRPLELSSTIFGAVLGVLAAALCVITSASLCGAALWRACGLARAATAGPAPGLAALMALSAAAIRLPGRGTTAALACALALAGSAIYLRGASRPRWPLLTAALALAAAMIPFLVAGHGGLLGAGTDDDMAEHLLAAWTLLGHAPLASSKLIASGYPLGPHALAATLSSATGLGLEQCFTGLIVAVPALLGLAATPLLPDRRPALRAVLAAAIGTCYLQAAFLAQASFKETIESVMAVAFAAALLDKGAPGDDGRFRLAPLGLLAAGSVYVYSYPGLAWLGGTALLYGLASGALDRAGFIASARAAIVPIAIAIGTFAIAVAPEAQRLLQFSGSGFNREAAGVLGDLLAPLPPLEALGVWPRLDFRFGVPVLSLGGLLTAAAVAVSVAALVRCVRRRELLVPAAVATVAALCAFSASRSPYTAAKALAIAAPFATLLLAGELLWLLPERGRIDRLRAAAAGGIATLVAAGGYCSLQVLRDAPVGPPAHAAELGSLRGVLARAPTLFLGVDDYVHWELRGADVTTPPEPLYTRAVAPLRLDKALETPAAYVPGSSATTTDRLAGVGVAFDFDSVPAADLDRYAYVIAPRSGYVSQPPANWRAERTTRSYVLWRRHGPTAPHRTLVEVDNPGVTFDCRSAAGRAIAYGPGIAMVRPRPVVGARDSWRGRIGYAGAAAHQSLALGPGAWLVSLQYDSVVPVTVTGPGLSAVLPATLEPLGPFWLAGTIRVRGRARVTIAVVSRRLGLAGRLLSAVGLTRAPAPTGIRALGRVAASPAPVRDRAVPLRRACGQYVDWYIPG